ncbi:hypothetical protein CYMTET_45051 [Cymbomonas tetramitiformis]|uniref:Uncharacterized protein n=1 Tax=Cymbomonas tetramitiformis TaxID=36881 RepID=A0AAE0EYZ8_9CHLO|nr:hypothetical protein CYMTET_45051 [Cymbomonas tetramitiformis]
MHEGESGGQDSSDDEEEYAYQRQQAEKRLSPLERMAGKGSLSPLMMSVDSQLKLSDSDLHGGAALEWQKEFLQEQQKHIRKTEKKKGAPSKLATPPEGPSPEPGSSSPAKPMPQLVNEGMQQHRNDASVQRWACKVAAARQALAYLALEERCKGSAAMIAQAGGIYNVVQAMQRHLQVSEVQAYGAKALQNVALTSALQLRGLLPRGVKTCELTFSLNPRCPGSAPRAE